VGIASILSTSRDLRKDMQEERDLLLKVVGNPSMRPIQDMSLREEGSRDDGQVQGSSAYPMSEVMEKEETENFAAWGTRETWGVIGGGRHASEKSHAR